MKQSFEAVHNRTFHTNQAPPSTTLQTGLVRNISLPILNDDIVNSDVYNINHTVPRVLSFSTLYKPSVRHQGNSPDDVGGSPSSITSSESDSRVPQFVPLPPTRRRPRRTSTRYNHSPPCQLPYVTSMSISKGKYAQCAHVPDSLCSYDNTEDIIVEQDDKNTYSDVERYHDTEPKVSFEKYHHVINEDVDQSHIPANLQSTWKQKYHKTKFIRVVSTILFFSTLLLHVSRYEINGLRSAAFFMACATIVAGRSKKAAFMFLSLGVAKGAIAAAKHVSPIMLIWTGILPVIVVGLKGERYGLITGILEAIALLIGIGAANVDKIDRVIVAGWVFFMGVLMHMQRR